MNDFWALANSITNLEILKNIDLKKYSTLQLKAQGDLIIIKSNQALKELLPLLKKSKMDYRILGQGANQALPRQYNGVYLKLNLPFEKDYLNQVRDLYQLPASLSLATLSSHASKFGLKGWEVFTGIPATIGGAIFMNAGTNLGEIGSLVTKVKYISREGALVEHMVNENSFSYRKTNFLDSGDVVYEIEMKHFGIDPEIKSVIREYLLKRNKTQPMKENTCGCVFKNKVDGELTCRAGEYIDIMGLKGLTLGSMMISPLHANFMINNGEGTKEEMISLIKLVQDELYLQYGIKFDTEVKF